MRRWRWVVPALLALLSGCRADSTSADTRHYACAQDDDCAVGFVCRTGTCQAPGTDALDAGAEPDAGPVENRGDGGVPGPAQLAIVRPAQPALVGECTAAQIETRAASGSALPVGAALAVTLRAQPAGGVAFYEDAACSKTTSSVTVQAGTSSATFYYRGTVAQTVSVGADAPGLTSAQSAQELRAAAPASVLFITSAQTLQAGGCSARMDLELRDTYANPAPPSTSRALTLSGSSSAGVSFYSDASCTTALTSAAFAAGAARTSFYFKGKTGGVVPITLTATVSGVPSPARQDQTLLPMVRSGRCVLTAGSLSVSCPISPAQSDMSKTMMFFQASPANSSPSSGSVRCVLSARDFLTCSHNSTYSADMQIAWKTVEMASGILVQHKQPTCAGGTPYVPVFLDTSVDPTKSFVLVSGEQGGNILGEDDFFTAKLADSGVRVDVQFSNNCFNGWKGSIQVVQLDAAQVTRGTNKMVGTDTQAYTSNLTPANLGSSVLLFTYRVSNAGTSSLCDRVMRGDLTATTSVNFYRSANNTANCTTAVIDEIAWERIDFGALAQVQSRLVGFNAAESVVRIQIPFTTVDPTRLLMFASGQGMNGQAGGEASYAGDDLLGESLATFEINPSNPSQLQITRNSSQSGAGFNVFMAQFEP